MIQAEYARMYALEKDYWWYRGLHELVETAIQKYSPNTDDCRILDAGCGTGRMMQVASKFGRVRGMDYSQEAIFFCQKNNLQGVCCQDLNEWIPEENLFDIIISLDVLYHAAIQNDAEVVIKFHQALSSGGVCIVNLPAFPVLFRKHDLAVHTKRRYRKKEAVLLFEHAGFEVQFVTYRLPHLFCVILAKKIIQRFFGTKDESDLQALPQWLDTFLYRMLRFENRLICSGLFIPFGSSLFLIARKNRASKSGDVPI